MLYVQLTEKINYLTATKADYMVMGARVWIKSHPRGIDPQLLEPAVFPEKPQSVIYSG